MPHIVVGNSSVSFWLPPMDDFVKINWDVAVDHGNRKMGIEVIIRDSRGGVKATLAVQKAYIIAPDIAKALAALKAVSLSRDLSFYKVVLKGGALSMVQVLRSSGSNCSHYGHLIEETRSLLNG